MLGLPSIGVDAWVEEEIAAEQNEAVEAEECGDDIAQVKCARALFLRHEVLLRQR